MIGEYRDLSFEAHFTGPLIRLLTPEDITSSTTAKWTTHNSLGGLERAEPVGIALAPLNFTLKLRSDAGRPVREMIDILDGYVLDHKAGMFILGGYALKRGAYFYMESVSEAYGMIRRDGGILSAKVDVKLKQYN